MKNGSAIVSKEYRQYSLAISLATILRGQKASQSNWLQHLNRETTECSIQSLFWAQCIIVYRIRFNLTGYIQYCRLNGLQLNYRDSFWYKFIGIWCAISVYFYLVHQYVKRNVLTRIILYMVNDVLSKFLIRFSLYLVRQSLL